MTNRPSPHDDAGYRRRLAAPTPRASTVFMFGLGVLVGIHVAVAGYRRRRRWRINEDDSRLWHDEHGDGRPLGADDDTFDSAHPRYR